MRHISDVDAEVKSPELCPATELSVDIRLYKLSTSTVVPLSVEEQLHSDFTDMCCPPLVLQVLLDGIEDI